MGAIWFENGQWHVADLQGRVVASDPDRDTAVEMAQEYLGIS